MIVAITQPYFLPYIGYFQMMARADTFVLFDDVSFIKKGWINRNRILLNGTEHLFTLPVEKASQNRSIREHQLFEPASALAELNRTFRQAYANTPYFAENYPVVEGILKSDETNLADFLAFSLERLRDFLGLKTKIISSSSIPRPPEEKGATRILGLAESLGATTYLNLPGGRSLYDPAVFRARGMTLKFIAPAEVRYSQSGPNFLPWLSILDVMMYNSRSATQSLLTKSSLED
jgi:hypothetical protein